MSRISEIVPHRDGRRFTKAIMELVTGNPIVEESEPIKKNPRQSFPGLPLHRLNKRSGKSSSSK